MRITLAVVLGVVALALAGCTPGPGPLPIPPSPTATPVFASDEEALEAAVGLFGEYLAFADTTSPQEQLEGGRLEGFLASEALDESRESLQEWVDNGWSSSGHSSIDSPQLQSYRESQGVAAVTFYLCEDLSAVDVVDGTGVSVVTPGRRDRLPLEVEVSGQSSQNLRITRSDLWAGDDFC